MKIWSPFFGCAIAVMFALPAFSTDIRYKPVTRETVEARLRQYTGSDGQREETLKQMFVGAGCDGVSEQAVKGSKLPNLICVMPGGSGRVIIVGAHFDHVEAGDGVVDNWSGASLLPSLYEAVKAEPRKHTYIFIAFTDEEHGEVGSHFYAREMTKEQVTATDAMVNMDTLGLGPTEVWTSHSDKTLTSILVCIAAQLKLPISGANVEQIGNSDSEQFASRKIPRITIHSLTQQTWDAHILHTSKDKLPLVRLDDYFQTYRVLSAYLAMLDEVLPMETTKGH